MTLYLFDSNRAATACLAEHESLITREAFTEHSEFEGKFPLAAYDDLVAATYAVADECDEVFLVEHVETISDGGSWAVIAKGRSATALLHTRVLENDNAWSSTAPGTIVGDIVERCQRTRIVSSKDTYINKAAATTNYEHAGILRVGFVASATEEGRALLEFPLVGFGPTAPTTILYVRVAAIGSGGTAGAVSVYRLRRTDVSASQATWNIYKTANNWTTAGAASTASDYDNGTVVTGTAPSAVGMWQAFDVTTLAQAALDAGWSVLPLRLSATYVSANRYTDYADATVPGSSPFIHAYTASGARAIPGLAWGTGDGLGTATDLQQTWEDAGDVVRDVLDAAELGMKATLSGTTITLDVYEPSTSAVSVGETWGNAAGGSIADDIADWRNYATVLGEGDGSAREYVYLDLTGSDPRRELYVDARDIQRTVDDTTLTIENYRAALTQRGAEKLADARRVQFVDAETTADLSPGDLVYFDADLWAVELLALEIEKVRESGRLARRVTLGQTPGSLRALIRRQTT